MGIVPDFRFDASVASVFSDMITRSVPGYSTVIAVSGVLADRFSIPNTYLYDLGCSLGATSLALAEHAAENCQLFAVDNSRSMLEQFEMLLQTRQLTTPVQLVCENIENVAIQNASVVALNYTLQFVPLEKRSDLLSKIYAGMATGGVFILSEKVVFDNQLVNDLFVDLHHEFKRSNGYSDLEISQKRQAIEDVLVAESLDAHKNRLKEIGFRRIEVWFQCLNFASLVAFK